MVDTVTSGEEQGANFLAQMDAEQRKTSSYNALNKIYGPGIAGDPQAAADAAKAALLQQEAPDLAQQPYLENQQTQANTGNLQAETATRQAGLPYVGPQAAAELAGTTAKTAQSQAETANTAAELPYIPGEARSKIALQGAQAGEAGSEAAKNQVDTQIAQQGQAFLGLATLSGGLASIRDQAVQGGAKDGGAAAIASAGPQYAKSLIDAGIPPDQVTSMIRSAVANPSSIDAASGAATAHYNALAQSKGMPVLTPQALTQAAENYKATGQLPSFGFGGGKLNAGIVSVAAGQPGGITGVPAAAQAYKGRQDFINDLSKTGSMTSLGGRVASIDAIANHIDLMQQLAKAMGNGDLRAANAVQAEWKKQFGSPMPTNYAAQKPLLAGELTRYYTARGDTKMTQQTEDALNQANSFAQTQGVLDTWRQDAGAQLAGFRQSAAANNAADAFDAHLTPRAKALLSQPQARAPAGPTATGPKGEKYILQNGAWVQQ